VGTSGSSMQIRSKVFRIGVAALVGLCLLLIAFTYISGSFYGDRKTGLHLFAAPSNWKMRKISVADTGYILQFGPFVYYDVPSSTEVKFTN
jgi:hypothetical protein